MDSVIRRTDIELEALKPTTQKMSAFSSYSPRRSHLESESYNSLVRILSYCLDHSLVSPPPPPERPVFVRNPTSSQEREDIHHEEEAGANINEVTLLERQEVDRCADVGGHERSSVADALLSLDLDDDEFEACVDIELLSNVISDCGRLIGLPNGELCSSGESHEINKGQVDYQQAVDKDLEITKACLRGAVKGVSIIGEASDVAEGDVNGQLLRNVMLDFDGLIDVPNKELCLNAQSHDRNEQAGHDENGLETTKARVHDEEDEIFNLGEVSALAKRDANSKLLSKAPDPEIADACSHGAKEGISKVSKGDELEKIQPNVSEEKVFSSMEELTDRRNKVEDIGNLVCSELVQDGISKVEDERKVTEQPAYVHSTSLMDSSEVRILEEDQVRDLALQVDKGEFEEGEIPDEIQDLEGPVDINDEGNQRQGRLDFDELASTTTSIHRKEDFELGIGNTPSTVERRGASFDSKADLSDSSEMDSADEATQRKQMVMKSREMKRKPLTEERKTKKKIAKKRKRAQKNREQGVKKLKLQIITKPKEVKICNFYVMGKCQQGNLCKYSHDAPLMKSAPCKYFACNSCLKGDDCPYDHELSKYPCHKYVSTGSCIRGDECKFSHKMPAADQASVLTSAKLDSTHLTSEKTKLKNQPVRSLLEGNDKGTPLMVHTPLKGTNQVPKGVRFLSFGATQADRSSEIKKRLPVKTSGQNAAYNQQRQDDVFANGRHHAALSITSPETNKHEVSEATKILEEFLFCSTT